MSKVEILKELESISNQLDSTSNGFVENESDLGGAKNDLNYTFIYSYNNYKLTEWQIK